MDEEIRKMQFRQRDELHLAEQAAEAPEILILDPAGRREAHDGDRELILACHERVRDVELRRRKRVLAVADVRAIDVDDERRLCAAKRHEHAAAVPVLRHREIAHIRADRIVLLRNVAGLDVLMAVPRIRHVRVLRHAIALHLEVRRHADRLPIAAIVVRCFESHGPRREILCKAELPEAVEAQFIGALPFCELRKRAIEPVAAVRGQAVLFKERRVRELSPVKVFFHVVLPLKKGQLAYRTTLSKFFRPTYLLISSHVSSSFATIFACSSSVSVTFAR